MLWFQLFENIVSRTIKHKIAYFWKELESKMSSTAEAAGHCLIFIETPCSIYLWTIIVAVMVWIAIITP